MPPRPAQFEAVCEECGLIIALRPDDTLRKHGARYGGGGGGGGGIGSVGQCSGSGTTSYRDKRPREMTADAFARMEPGVLDDLQRENTTLRAKLGAAERELERKCKKHPNARMGVALVEGEADTKLGNFCAECNAHIIGSDA